MGILTSWLDGAQYCNLAVEQMFLHTSTLQPLGLHWMIHLPQYLDLHAIYLFRGFLPVYNLTQTLVPFCCVLLQLQKKMIHYKTCHLRLCIEHFSAQSASLKGWPGGGLIWAGTNRLKKAYRVMHACVHVYNILVKRKFCSLLSIFQEILWSK